MKLLVLRATASLFREVLVQGYYFQFIQFLFYLSADLTQKILRLYNKDDTKVIPRQFRLDFVLFVQSE